VFQLFGSYTLSVLVLIFHGKELLSAKTVEVGATLGAKRGDNTLFWSILAAHHPDEC